jgi:hypothetical protein
VNAIHRAGLDAQLVLGTGIRNYVCHTKLASNSPASPSCRQLADNAR